MAVIAVVYRCVRRYDGHMNRVHCCMAEISPCCRYVATGSEDKCVRISSSFILLSRIIIFVCRLFSCVLLTV